MQEIQQSLKQKFIQQLRCDYPQQTTKTNPQKLELLVEQSYLNAQELEIFDEENIYRFISLQFLPKELLESPFIQSVLIRVLNNFNLSATKRLDFIEQQITARVTPIEK
ncbi:MAG: hypothetical protein HC877_23725 [Thioploca sp.]|nr:hypothetical protein [Thioploca sp.]